MKRKKITLSFQYEENWIGGTYYILNIIRALNTLDDAHKPHITVLHSPQSSTTEIECINYPYINFISFDTRLSLVKRIINQIFYIIRNNALFKIRLPGEQVENLYPAMSALDTSNVSAYYTWIPDFQEYYLPHFFSFTERRIRKNFHRRIVKLKMPVVFSSHSSLADFDKFYPENQNKKFVMPFVSILDNRYNGLDIDLLKAKFSINKPYFIIANQFWKHKNHLTAIKAFEILSKNEPDIQLVLTGKEYDHRNPSYPAALKQYVADIGLEKKILFLGFIDRMEQLKLMKESLAIIQPSLFEGWSTVVEDSKSLGKLILLSDISVHREQISENCIFFEPQDIMSLLKGLKEIIYKTPSVVNVNYSQNIRNFAVNFLTLFN